AHRADVACRSFEELRHRDTAYAIAALQGLAALHEQEHRPDEALECLEDITRLVPDNVHFWRLRAEACAVRQRPADAAAAYRQAIGLRPRRREEAEIRRRLIGQLVAAGDTDGAREELERLISSDDNLTPEVAKLAEQLDLAGLRRSSTRQARPQSAL